MHCPYCGAQYRQQKKGFSKTGLQRFICQCCKRHYTTETTPCPPPNKEPIVRLCAQCGRETTNPKFCSSSCSAIYTNHTHPKRKKIPRFCKYCGTPLEKRAEVCNECLHNKSIKVDWSRRTFGEIKQWAKHNTSSVLRDFAKRTYKKSNHPLVCQRCGYSKHVEICHIQPIRSFPDDTRADVISGLDNLIALCPNCHWEFDHGLLKIDSIEE